MQQAFKRILKGLQALVVPLVVLGVQQDALASNCPDLYPFGKPFGIKGSTELCNGFYVSLYDMNNKAVLAVSERLHPNATHVSRLSTFRQDLRVGKASATNSDYTRSGYDRGHMAPAGDASTSDEMYSTFFFTNMTPQNPVLNRGEWAHLEEKVRKGIKDDTWVLNIAMYGVEPKRIGTGIPVPKGYWKIVYTAKGAKYFYAENTAISTVQPIQYIDVDTLLKGLP
jgi:endonuclease G